MQTAAKSMYQRLLFQTSPTSILSHDLDAKPLYVITGANFIPYDQKKHGHEATHAYFPQHQNDDHPLYLMNNGATTALRLIEKGENVLLHGRDSLALKTALNGHINNANLAITGGDLSVDEDASRLITSIFNFASKRKISDVRLFAYQSFAQSSGKPFKIMPEEPAHEVERAASRRIRFVYNMAAIGYWLLCEQNQSSLRVVSMSALAAGRPSFGLMADTADKFMNEACWRTFHLEANHITGKPVNVIQINPGIITAGDIYRGGEMDQFIREEAKADGFPLAANQTTLPQLSAHQIGEVAYRMLAMDTGTNPNHKLPADIRATLYGGYSPKRLRSIFKQHVQLSNSRAIEIGTAKAGPDHLFAAHTIYGALPRITAGAYQRISMTPVGQTF